jgi:type I restriction enzyme S subunit
LLLAEDGKNLESRTKPIALQATGKFWVNNHAHVMTCLSGCALSYLETYFNSVNLSHFLTGMDQVKLTRSDMNQIPVALPPLAEQDQIVAEVERCFSIADEVEATIEAELKRADRLRQSILKDAFSGKLVPQDPDDEPASVLLERIKIDKAQQETKTKKLRTPRRRTKSIKGHNPEQMRLFNGK